MELVYRSNIRNSMRQAFALKALTVECNEAPRSLYFSVACLRFLRGFSREHNDLADNKREHLKEKQLQVLG